MVSRLDSGGIANAEKGGKMKASEYILTATFQNMLAIFDVEIEDFTCHNCEDKENCQSSYDIYNIDGDCLEEK